METYSLISIIFNPKSTGASEKNAKQLLAQLQAHQGVAKNIQLLPTKHAGHAETLAYNAAKAHHKPLIISSSGDGGYNEVINGVMRAAAEGAEAITGLLPSGNANDHYHSLTSGDLEKLVQKRQERVIDLIKVTTRHQDTTWERYAHSYTGIGLTADASIEYNKISMNRINELLVSVKAIYNSRRSEVIIDNTVHMYDSLVFSNVNRLGKMFTLSERSKVNDGRFEVIALKSKNKAELLQQLALALTAPFENLSHAATFTFTTTTEQAMQFDGEVFTLKPQTIVTVTSAAHALRCIL